jgi:hypothetical protein
MAAPVTSVSLRASGAFRFDELIRQTQASYEFIA